RRRTGVYKDDSLILTSRAACSPCAHSSVCSQPSHLCAVPVSVDVVLPAVRHCLKDEWPALQALAGANRDLQVLRARRLTLGFWYAQDLGETRTSRMASDLLKRVAWKLAFNRGRGDRSVEFGSAGMALRHELSALSGADF